MHTKKKLIITGQKVHDIGYRPYLLGIAEAMEIERFFVDNTFLDEKQVVYALVDSSDEKVRSFIEMASSKYPDKSDVEKVEVEDYKGNVMKIESFYRYLTAMQLSKIANYGGKMLDKQDKTLDKQDLHIEITRNGFNEMLNKQDESLKMQTSLLNKQDESLKTLNNINNDTSEIKSTMKTMEMDIRDARFSLSHLIETKLKKHESDIAQIKTTLAQMQEAIKAI